MEPFDYIVMNEKKIRSMLLKMAMGDKHLADEMFSEVALERIHRLFELHDGIRPLDNYVMNNLRWYAFKYRNKRKPSSLERGEYTESHTSIDVQLVLDKCNEMDRYLLTAYFLYDMTYSEIAEQLNWSTTQVSRAVKEAILNVRIMGDGN